MHLAALIKVLNAKRNKETNTFEFKLPGYQTCYLRPYEDDEWVITLVGDIDVYLYFDHYITVDGNLTLSHNNKAIAIFILNKETGYAKPLKKKEVI